MVIHLLELIVLQNSVTFNPTEHGEKLGDHCYCNEWITIAEAPLICKELICCRCNKEK